MNYTTFARLFTFKFILHVGTDSVCFLPVKRFFIGQANPDTLHGTNSTMLQNFLFAAIGMLKSL
jgi:hypothetical protein